MLSKVMLMLIFLIGGFIIGRVLKTEKYQLTLQDKKALKILVYIIIAIVAIFLIASVGNSNNSSSSHNKGEKRLVSGTCSHCHGSGKTEYGRECGYCNGTGFWAYYDD